MRKKILFLAIALLSIASFSKADNVGIDDFTIKQGDTLQVALKLTNTHADLTAFSMTLTLPKGLKLYGAEATSRFDGNIQVGSPDTNTYNICGIDLNGGTIHGSTGELLILTFVASKDFKGGVGTITEVDFITTGRQHVRCSDTTFDIDYKPFSDILIGDADGNGEVDISDVMTTVNKSLGKEVAPFIFDNADTDKNGEIDIVDVMNIVNIVLGR